MSCASHDECREVALAFVLIHELQLDMQRVFKLCMHHCLNCACGGGGSCGTDRTVALLDQVIELLDKRSQAHGDFAVVQVRA